MLDIESITNTIINDDCINILKQLPDKCIDLVVTSPPYDNLRTYNGTLEWNFEIFQNIAKELARVLKDGGVIVWIVNDSTVNGSETGTSFKQALYFKELGLNIHDTMIWNKENSPFNHNCRYTQVFEYMFVLSKNMPKTTNIICDRKNKRYGEQVHGTERTAKGTTKQRSLVQKSKTIKEFGNRHNIWNIFPEKNNTTGHPAVFPYTLAHDHIISWSNENDLILDCFSGSGTTAVACHNLERRFICIEKDYDYWKASVERLENAQAQLKLF